MTRILTSILALTAMAFAGTAVAGKKPDFKEADANGDGKVSVQEASKAGAPKKEAKKADIDDDGKLTQSDWEFVDWPSGKKKESGQS